MMILSNNNCSLIDATSVYIDDVINNLADYSKIVIEARTNCCETVYTETITSPSPLVNTEWNIDLPIGISPILIKEVRFRNINTGRIFTLPSFTPVTLSTVTDLFSLSTTINNFFASQYSAAITVTSTQIQNANTFSYALTLGNPDFIPVSIVYEIDGIEATTAFRSTMADTVYLTGTGISITPLLFGLDSFIDGVYSVKITMYKNSGSRVTTSNCIFVDCVTNCDLSDILPTLSESGKIEALMMHYGLSVGTNCACDCEMLCDLYKQLYKVIHNTEINNNCGCN